MFKRIMLRVVTLVVLLSLTFMGSLATLVSATEPFSHTVKWGETLSWISWTYRVPIRDIMDANDLSSNAIYAGQKLVIPGMTEQHVEHVIKPGESLLSIAAKYGVSIWDLAGRNGILNMNLIVVGDRIMIPGVTEESTSTPDSQTPTESPADTETDLAESVALAVQEAILITSPTAGDQVSTPITVKGWGSGFENNLAVDVLDGSGRVIGQGYAMISAEMGQTGPYSGTISFTPPSVAQLGRVSVYSISPRDGAIEHLASVTVNLNP